MGTRTRVCALILTIAVLAGCSILPEPQPPEPAVEEEPQSAIDQTPPEDGATADTGSAESTTDPQTPPLGIRPIARGQQSAVRVPVSMTISDQGLLAEVWAAIHANTLNPPRTPSVDFSKEVAILLILGERLGEGHGIRSAGVAKTASRVEITVRVESPDPDADVSQVYSSPFELAAIPRTGLPIMFVGDDITEGFDPE